MPNNCPRCRMPGCDGTCPPDYDRPGQPGGMFSGPVTESRGAASVTLDTIIANALKPVFEKAGKRESAWSNEAAEAVTDALLAKGLVDYVGPDTFDQVFVLRIPGRES